MIIFHQLSCAAQQEQQLVLGTFLLITYSQFRSLGFCYIISHLFLSNTFLHDFQKKKSLFAAGSIVFGHSDQKLIRD